MRLQSIIISMPGNTIILCSISDCELECYHVIASIIIWPCEYIPYSVQGKHSLLGKHSGQARANSRVVMILLYDYLHSCMGAYDWYLKDYSIRIISMCTYCIL